VTAAHDAVVLCGGAGSRMGGVDKAALEVGGSTLLDRVLDASAGATTQVCVGPPRPTSRPVVWCREDPAGGGPAAALVAALPHVREPLVVLLAADLPRLTSAAVAALVGAAATGGTGAVLVDGSGRDQWLTGCWPTAALRGATAGVSDGSLRSVLAPLVGERLHLPGDPWQDCDTRDDLEQARGQGRRPGARRLGAGSSR
jgi:molybdopterin-guanine dinucleotide biosynthesis protein A